MLTGRPSKCRLEAGMAPIAEQYTKILIWLCTHLEMPAQCAENPSHMPTG